ncbi:MAG: fumarylacetoacetate hydrolase family protein [Candidatus Omnitrophica bacterium]|nr:fumarylacetoacetate hydrolase family protein [Candidatus Omnitrophota bacterium]
MKRKTLFLFLIISACLWAGGCAELNPFAQKPRPADFVHLWSGKSEGELLPLEIEPEHIYGLGLTYAKHLRETGSRFDAGEPPPVFRKDLVSLNKTGAPVPIPDRERLIASCEGIEPGLGRIVDKKFKDLPPLLDYEGELAFVLLEDVDWSEVNNPDYSPKIGYFLANDLSARSIAVLGEGMPNRYDYWGVSKSFPGFLPVGAKMWVPPAEKPDSILRVVIVTKVNGELRQKESTSDMMYTPREMLSFIYKKYPDMPPRKGDIVLMGTPGGVAMQIPGWKAWLADLFRFDRFKKLSSLIASNKNNKKFLKPEDVVEVSGGILGELKTEIAG